MVRWAVAARGPEVQERRRGDPLARARKGHRLSLGARLGATHDAITRAGAGLAAALVAGIAAAFCYEVVARYAFNAPTEWASPLVSFLLAAMIFLMMPELTRRSAHISIDIVVNMLPPARALAALRAIRLLAAAACLLAAWFSGEETFRQYDQSIWTSPPFSLRKWTISVFLPYGMLSSALHFLRQVFAPSPTARAAAPREGAVQ